MPNEQLLTFEKRAHFLRIKNAKFFKIPHFISARRTNNKLQLLDLGITKSKTRKRVKGELKETFLSKIKRLNKVKITIKKKIIMLLNLHELIDISQYDHEQ
uniref:Uncharacterized protein n=1 Tax=Cacopsylla melanoneura TaxID=428564 RepID=A0A8D8RHS4_9HEMI